MSVAVEWQWGGDEVLIEAGACARMSSRHQFVFAWAQEHFSWGMRAIHHVEDTVAGVERGGGRGGGGLFLWWRSVAGGGLLAQQHSLGSRW